MKSKTMILMVVAVVCGLAASYMTSRLLAERNAQAQTPMVKVLVSITKVPMRAKLTEPDKYFVLQDVPETTPSVKKALTKPEDLKNQFLNKNLPEGHMITKDDLLSGDQDPIATGVPEGWRAIALRVNAESLAGGFVFPGSRVDVVATMRRGDVDSESLTIMQDVKVMAVDNKVQRAPEDQNILGQTVTLCVRPEDAMRLALASSLSDLRLLVRGLQEKEKPREYKPARLVDLRRNPGDSAAPPTPEETAPPLQAAPTVKLPFKLPAESVDDKKVEPTRTVEVPVKPEPAKPVEVVTTRPASPEKHVLMLENGSRIGVKEFTRTKNGKWSSGLGDEGEDPAVPGRLPDKTNR